MTVLRYVRLLPFDESTPAGRSAERHRRVALSAGAAALSKILGLLTTLITIPLVLGYLGTERFGVWSTFVALVATLQFADLGIGNGVINTVSDAHGKEDRVAVRRFVCSGLVAATLMALVVLLLTPVVVAAVPLADLLKLSDPLARSEVTPALAVFLICVALAIPAGIVQRLQIGLQLGFIASLWQCAANITSLLAIWVTTQLQLGLPWLMVSLLGAPVLTALVNGIVFFWRQAPDLRPSAAHVSVAAVKQVMTTGMEFLLLQLAVAIVLSADSIIIAYVMGAAAVAQFAVPEKLFSIVIVLLATGLNPLWPAYREAIARGDLAWATRTLRRSLLVAIGVASLATIALVALGPWLIELWVGPQLLVSQTLLVALGLWKIIESAGLAASMFLNGAGVIRLQVVSACIMMAATVLLKPWMVREVGLEGAPLSSAVIYTTCSLLPLMFVIRHVLRELRLRQANATLTAVA